MREMTMNLNGPDSPPSIILKAEPESSDSQINYVAGDFTDTRYQQRHQPPMPDLSSSPLLQSSSANQHVGDIQFHVTAEAMESVLRKRESSVPSMSSPIPGGGESDLRSRSSSLNDYRPPGFYMSSPTPYTYQPRASTTIEDRTRFGSVQSMASSEYSEDGNRNNNSIDEPNLASTQSVTTRVRRGSRKPYHRTTFTDYQIQELTVQFNEKKYLSMQERGEIAERLSISQNQVKIWFQVSFAFFLLLLLSYD